MRILITVPIINAPIRDSKTTVTIALTSKVRILRMGSAGGPILAKKWFPRPPANLDIDYIYDSAIRADLLVDVLCKRAENKTPPIPEVQPEQGVMYYIIHPVLKHLARLSCQ